MHTVYTTIHFMACTFSVILHLCAGQGVVCRLTTISRRRLDTCRTYVQGKASCAASQQGTDPDWVELLLKNGCDVDFKDGDGKTALDTEYMRQLLMSQPIVRLRGFLR